MVEPSAAVDAVEEISHEEVEVLRAENDRLRAENEQLRAAAESVGVDPDHMPPNLVVFSGGTVFMTYCTRRARWETPHAHREKC